MGPAQYTSLRLRKGKLTGYLGKLTNVKEAPYGLLWLERHQRCVLKTARLLDALTGDPIEVEETEPCRRIITVALSVDNK